MIRITVVIALSTAVVVLPRAAQACSSEYCSGAADVLPGDKAHLPANGAFFWAPISYNEIPGIPQVDSITLTREDTGEEVDVDVTPADVPHFYDGTKVFTIAARTALEPGVSYTLRTGHMLCVNGSPTDPLEPTVFVEDVAELPTALGTLNAGPAERRMETLAEDGSCAWDQDVLITEVSLDLDPSMLPWRDSIAYETVVDDEFWRPSHASNKPFPLGGSWTSRGKDAVFAICNEGPYSEHSWLAPGTHTVKMRGRIPGSDLVLESNTVTVDLNCELSPNPYWGGSADTGPAVDEPAIDAGTASNDEPTGCASAGGAAHGPAVLLALLGLFGRRRRHRAGHGTCVSS